MTVTNGKSRGIREWAASRLLRDQPVKIIVNVIKDATAKLQPEEKRSLAAAILPVGVHTHKSPPGKKGPRGPRQKALDNYPSPEAKAWINESIKEVEKETESAS